MVYLFTGLSAYLIGAFPSAYIFSRLFKGIDIRKAGSGNVGGMNTIREAGPLPGILTILADTGKGILAVCLAGALSENPAMPLLSAFAVILGHNFNIFLGFRGGKGLATALGAFLALSPTTIPFILALMVLFSLLLRDTNTGFGTGVALLPPVLWFQHHHWSWLLMGTAMATIIVIKHLPDFASYHRGRRKLF